MALLGMEEKKELPADFWTATVDVDPLAQTPDVGADLSLIEEHETELGGIVEQMWKDMTNETKILEDTEIPEREDIVIPPPENPDEVLKQIRLSPESETKK
jgi:hypothetical protein